MAPRPKHKENGVHRGTIIHPLAMPPQGVVGFVFWKQWFHFCPELITNQPVIARHPPLRNCHTTLFLSDNSFWDRFLARSIPIVVIVIVDPSNEMCPMVACQLVGCITRGSPFHSLSRSLSRSQWPELTCTDLGAAAPQIIPCQVDVLPAQRR